MPSYDYVCLSCAHRFEARQAMSAAPLDECPECGGNVRRIITGGSGFMMKGGGAAAPRTTACGSDTPCCGRGEPCGKSHGCH
ncbi:MAG: zinc ribbon domain-containing protein [Spirochaetes bacterium]|nr:zinc ribbon domain-containing protein [Spirochaetota bacterium]